MTTGQPRLGLRQTKWRNSGVCEKQQENSEKGHFLVVQNSKVKLLSLIKDVNSQVRWVHVSLSGLGLMRAVKNMTFF